MVPQIKPKLSSINPSPMKLHKSKTINGIQPFEFESYSDNEEKEINEYLIKDDNDKLSNVQDLNANGNKVNNPKTRDEENTILCLAAGAFALIGIAILNRKKK